MRLCLSNLPISQSRITINFDTNIWCHQWELNKLCMLHDRKVSNPPREQDGLNASFIHKFQDPNTVVTRANLLELT